MDQVHDISFGIWRDSCPMGRMSEAERTDWVGMTRIRDYGSLERPARPRVEASELG
jgi:hypothetical protein